MGIGAMKRAVFLDRDGVVNPLCGLDAQGHPESPLRVEDFHIFPFVGEAIRNFNRMGYSVFVISNQPAYAKGKMLYGELLKMNILLKGYLKEEGAFLHGIYYCLHHPDPNQVAIKSLLGDCFCRKPKPGLLFLARAEHRLDLSGSWMVGDGSKDIEAGRKAGCRTILILSDRREECKPDFTAADLSEAVKIIKKEAAK